MKPLLQSTASECGNTCLRMIAQAHGLILDDVGGLRAASQCGATLAQLVNAAGEVGLAASPPRLELDELSQLKSPCVLWCAPALTGVVLAAVLAYGLLRALMYRPLHDAAAERLVMAAKENTHFLETLRSMLPLKLFGREEQRHARWQSRPPHWALSPLRRLRFEVRETLIPPDRQEGRLRWRAGLSLIFEEANLQRHCAKART